MLSITTFFQFTGQKSNKKKPSPHPLTKICADRKAKTLGEGIEKFLL